MTAKLFSAKPKRVQAIQLLTQTDPYNDNVKEIADWCSGSAIWNYNSETDERSNAIVSFANQIDIFRVEETDWVICTIDGEFYSLSDEEFREEFDTEDFDAPPTCPHCLSDPRYTPMGDPHEKRCPVCEVRYSGPVRTKEYAVLVASGLVSREKV